MTKGIHRIGELSGDGVFIYDFIDKRFTYLNAPFAALFKFSVDQLLDDPQLLMPLLNTEDVSHLQHAYDDLLHHNAITGKEFRIMFAGNVSKYLCADIYLLADNEVAGFVRDITREKEHESYIMNYGAKKDTLLDMMTHNLAGPLHLTQNIIRRMQEIYKEQASENIQAQLRLIQSATQECVDIVNDFLREEHMESERVYVRKTRFDLLERIMSTLDKLVATNKNKKFRLITELKSLNISTDSVKFFQVIHNLISNSIKFTPDGGEIDILVEETDLSFIVRVRDNGIGIPRHLHANLFMRDPNSQRVGLGNERSIGLGLHIVKTLVALMDGQVSFESDENKGSTFSIELPKE